MWCFFHVFRCFMRSLIVCGNIVGTSMPLTPRTCSNPNKDVFTRQLLLEVTRSSRNRSSHGSNTCSSAFPPCRFVICTFQQVELTIENCPGSTSMERANQFVSLFWCQANQNCEVNDANFCTHHSFGSACRQPTGNCPCAKPCAPFWRNPFANKLAKALERVRVVPRVVQAVTQRHRTLQNVFLFSSVRANKARIGFPSKASSYVKVSA